MPSPRHFNTTIDNGSSFPGSRDEWLEDRPGLESTFVASPVQLLENLPDLEPSFLSPQPASSIYPPARDEYHSANFVAASPTPNARTLLDVHGWHLQTDPRSVQNYTPFFNPQYSGPTSTIMPTTHQPPATFNASRASMHDDFQGYSYAVMNGSSHIHDAFYSPPNHFSAPNSTVQSHYNGSSRFVHQTQSYTSVMGTSYQQIQPAHANATLSSSSIPSALAFQPLVHHSPLEEIPRRNSREGRSVTGSPYHPIRTSSLPVQSVSATQTVSHTCQWIKDDGIICTAPITRASVPEHLATHGVTNMAHDHPVPCRWSGCRIRGNRDMMNRESIVRHVREKHLRYRRSL